MHRRTDKGRAKQLLRGGGRRGNCAYTKNNNVRSVNDRKEQNINIAGFYNINKILIPFNTKIKNIKAASANGFTEMRNIPKNIRIQLKSTSRLTTHI
jgi:hypothetical protein